MDNPRLSILAPFKEWGGIERKVVTLCMEFLHEGVRPQLVLTRGGVTPYPNELPAEVEVVDLRSGGKLNSVGKLARFFRAERPDAVLTAKDHAAKVAVVARALSGIRVPIYVKVTNTLSSTLRRPVKRGTARLLYRYADRLIAVSAGVRDDLIRNFAIPPERIEVIYNPTVTPSIVERTKLPVEHPWLQGDGPPVVMGMGRLTGQKDFSTLLQAFARLRAHQPARLIILGEGPLRSALEDEAEQLGIRAELDLPGYVSDPIPYLARASLFALSSRYEGLANVAIEALAAGAPVVATDCPSGMGEILQGGRIGRLVPVGDIEGLAEAMRETIAAPPAPELLQDGLDRFRSETVARQYLHVMGLR